MLGFGCSAHDRQLERAVLFSASSNCHPRELNSGNAWRSRLVWSRAHDWKSCNRQKRFEGSNPSSSAIAERTGKTRLFCYGGGGERGRTLAAKIHFGQGRFPTYTCLKMCANATLPQGSAACAARRLRLFPRLERGVKSAKMLLIQSSILMANIPPPPPQQKNADPRRWDEFSVIAPPGSPGGFYYKKIPAHVSRDRVGKRPLLCFGKTPSSFVPVRLVRNRTDGSVPHHLNGCAHRLRCILA